MKKILPLLLIIIMSITACDETSQIDITLNENSTDGVTEETTVTIYEPVFNTEFTGIEINEKTPKRGNLPVNLVSTTWFEVYNVCVDEENNAVYYTNYDKNNYVYSYKDGVSELILEVSANYLNYWDGSLYYTSSDRGMPGQFDNFFSGKLYKYNLETKEQELILSDEIMGLWVTEKGLYFNKEVEGSTDNEGNPIPAYAMYNMPFDGEPDRCGIMQQYYYGEYQLSFNQNGLCLIKGDEEIPLITKNLTWQTFISDEKLYIKGTNLYSLDLTNGEIETIYIRAEPYISGDYIVEMHEILDFTIIDNDIYATAYNQFIYKYDREKEMFVPDGEFIGENGLNYHKIFTDGKNIFTIASKGYIDNRSEFIMCVRIPDGNGSWIEEKLP